MRQPRTRHLLAVGATVVALVSGAVASTTSAYLSDAVTASLTLTTAPADQWPTTVAQARVAPGESMAKPATGTGAHRASPSARQDLEPTPTEPRPTTQASPPSAEAPDSTPAVEDDPSPPEATSDADGHASTPRPDPAPSGGVTGPSDGATTSTDEGPDATGPSPQGRDDPAADVTEAPTTRTDDP